MSTFTRTTYPGIGFHGIHSKELITSDNEVDIGVGTNLHCRRIELGMSRENFASICKIDVQTVRRYEQGELRLSPEMFLKVVRVLKTDAKYLFTKIVDAG